MDLLEALGDLDAWLFAVLGRFGGWMRVGFCKFF